MLGYGDADLASFDADDRHLLLAALITKLYVRANGLPERETLAKLHAWPQSSDARRRAVRDNYMQIVRGNNSSWKGAFLLQLNAQPPLRPLSRHTLHGTHLDVAERRRTPGAPHTPFVETVRRRHGE